MLDRNIEFKSVKLGGLPTICCTRTELAQVMVQDALQQKDSSRSLLPKLVFSTNGQGIALSAKSLEFQEAMSKADIIHADGMPIVLFSKLTRSPLPDRIATTDFFHDAAKFASDNQLNFFMLGANEHENKQAVINIKELYPNLNIVGSRSGYYTEEETDSICNEIVACKTDILWVALGKPKQEYWAVQNKEKLRGVTWIKTCGGLYSFLSGTAPRAPKWMQRLGLEWLFRVWQEPTRLAGRYISTNFIAAIQLLTKSDYK